MVIKFRHLFSSACVFFCSILLTGCKLGIIDPKGTIAIEERQIMIQSALLMLIVVIPVIFLSLFFAWRYREGNKKATYAPEWAHSTTLEIIWWTIPIIIILILGTITWTSSHRLDPYKPISTPEKTLTIQAISLEWKWLFIYPEQNMATINEVYIPVNTPVQFLITAEGPMNSLQIPALVGQIYAMAGMQTKLHLITDTTGDYAGISTNFTGDGFSGMHFNVHVGTQDEFNSWVKQAKLSPNKLTVQTYDQLLKPSMNEAVKYYSDTNPGIYPLAAMKLMMPPGITAEEAAVLCKQKQYSSN